MAQIVIAGQELYNALQTERAKVTMAPRGYDSNQLSALQERQAARGIIGAELVKSIYGWSVRYNSGLQNWSLISPARGRADQSLAFAEQIARDWVAQDPTHRYATKPEGAA